MNTKFDPKMHQRKSIRLKEWDYSQTGGYYVTIVTFRRAPLFGEVLNGEMHLNALGKIVQEEWFNSAKIRKEIHLFEDEFVVMPNHTHGIVWIDTTTVRPDAVRLDGIRPNQGTGANDRGAYHAPLHRNPKSLGSFIAGFKASVTSRAGRELNSGNIWQRNYYEHILRDQADHERIAVYILDNPANWNNDDENPRNLAGKGNSSL